MKHVNNVDLYVQKCTIILTYYTYIIYIPKYISSFMSHIEKITNVVLLVEIVGSTLHMCLLGYYCILVCVLWNLFAAHCLLLQQTRESFLGLEPRRERRYSGICYNIDLGYFQHVYILLHWRDPFRTGNGNGLLDIYKNNFIPIDKNQSIRNCTIY